ncbi:MAG: PLDc_N domain-containing protein [Bacteroidetes bacterium]|nr:MAG: PLDc_N domain-containing protein [Bacteroidota bacterium]
MGIFAGIGILFGIFIFLLISFLWIIALVDILRSEFRGNDKVIWVIVVIFFPFLGSILYFIFGSPRKIR